MGLMISRPSRCFASSIALAAARDCSEPIGKSAGHIGAGWALALVTSTCSRQSCPSYGTTWKGTLLESVPLGVTTLTAPVVARVGTVMLINELETTVNSAATP